MSLPLDYKSVSTWENIDLKTACMRISSSEENEEQFNPGAARVSLDVFKLMQDKAQRAQFFVNCEKLGLRSWKLYFAYQYPCKGDYNKFIECVLKSDAAMLQALREQESRM